MTKTAVTRSPMQRIVPLMALAIALSLILSFMPFQASAQEVTGTVVNPYIVTLQPGEDMEINVHGFCLNYGLPFPGEVLKPIELASDPLRNAAINSLATGYVDSDPFGVQRAIWSLSNDTRIADEDYTIADEMVAYANSGVQPADVVAGVPHMVDLVADGTLEAMVVDFVNVAPEEGAFFGNGTLTISNISDAPQQFVVSYGTVVVDETEGDQQNMIIFPSAPAPVAPVPTTGALLSPVVLLALAGLAGLALGIFALSRMRRRASLVR